MTDALATDAASRDIAAILLEVGAVSINVANPFTYASGARSPIYCDNRVLMSHPSRRREVIRQWASLLDRQIGAGNFEVLAGVATSGIPFCAWLAEALDKPMVYVRDAAKAHGKGQQVEGVLQPGQRAVVIEDLVTTGRSALATVEGLRAAGAVAQHCAAIFTYESPAAVAAFFQAGVGLHTLSRISVLIEVATANGRISPADAAAVGAWLGEFYGRS